MSERPEVMLAVLLLGHSFFAENNTSWLLLIPVGQSGSDLYCSAPCHAGCSEPSEGELPPQYYILVTQTDVSTFKFGLFEIPYE